MDADVLICGAGPAGCATAAALHRVCGDRLRVRVLERYRFPRDKPCGGALTGRMVEAMDEVGLALTVDSVACETGLVRYGDVERAVTMGRPVRVVRRRELDKSFVDQVRALGIEVMEGEGLAEFHVGEDRVEVRTSRGARLAARVLVGADGVASPVRRHLVGDHPGTPHRLFAAEVERPSHLDGGTMIYDFSLMARGLRGYLWLFPTPGGRVNVGLMHYPSRHSSLGGRALLDLLRDGLAGYGVTVPDKVARGWPVWGYHPKSPVSADRILTVGDAAGIDGLTGEGIAIALEQAALAARLIAGAFDSGDFSFADYRVQLRRATVGRELALDRWLAWLLYGSKRWRDWLGLVLFDPVVIEMYARRVDGTDILADRKPQLYWSLTRHAVRRRARRRKLAGALSVE